MAWRAIRRWAGVTVVAVVVSGGAPGADWPQWRHDGNRSGATDEPGPSTGARLWERVLPIPDPAYDHQYRMCADVAYAPVAAGGLVFVPSNVTDDVTALDLATGAIRWRFFAEGPVRLAPVCVGGSVCFGSDDGYLYCVSAREGALLWKVRGAPEKLPESRVLINGRMCSRWPVRGAPVEDGGVIFFGAGIWPEEGVYVCAVKAATGEMIWRQDSLSHVSQGMSDHGRAYDIGLPPQGYLAHIDGRLAVPSGRSLAAWFDAATGSMEPYTCFYVKTNPPRGTWYLAGMGRYCVQGGNWFGTRADAVPEMGDGLREARSALFWSKETPENELHVIKNRPFLNADSLRLHNENWYSEPVLAPGVLYQSEFAEESAYLIPRGQTRVRFPAYDRIVARDMDRPRWTGVRQAHLGEGRKKVTIPRLEFPIKWEMASPLKVLLKAGGQLFAGGSNTVAAVAIPEDGEKPRIAWQASVGGTPVNALVADGRLVVATDEGRVVCFGDGGKHDGGTASVTGATDADRRASPKGGFALVVGCDKREQAEALAVQQDCRVILVESDAASAAAAKRWLAERGLQGRRVQVMVGNPGAMGLAPYWANRVLVGSPASARPEDDVLSAALDALRPHTGEMRFVDGAKHAARVARLLEDRRGYTSRAEGPDLVVRREAPPSGAANWTHEAGDAGNCFASQDKLVKWPLGVLWYSGDIDRFFTPETHFQHERNPYPLVSDGRMFIITGEKIHCVDIYTGSYLWRAEVPLTPYVKTRFFDSRQYGRPTDRSCAVAADWLYVVTGAALHAFDVASGNATRVIEIPGRLRDQAHSAIHETRMIRAQGQSGEVQGIPEWTEVRLCGDLLVAMLGRHLVALDRHTGELRWDRPSERGSTTCALGGGILFGLDYDTPGRGAAGKAGTNEGKLFAMNVADGAVRWEKNVAYGASPRETVREELARAWHEPIQPVLAHNAKHGLIVLAANRNELQVFRAADGAPAWSGPRVTQQDLRRVYAPVVTEDYLLLSEYKGAYGYLFDIVTGKEAGENTAIPRPRTCARVIGNNHLLVYRDAATELYDIDGNRMIGLNSMRSGCTTSFIPAGGIMAAPMLGHGCVCNYPMFASVALHHMPDIDRHRPARVTASWVNQAKSLEGGGSGADGDDDDDGAPVSPEGGAPMEVGSFRLLNATMEASDGGALFRTSDEKAGYAVRRADAPISKAIFRFTVQRAAGKSGEKRHGNAFFVFGGGPDPGDWVECQLYYGGRSSLVLAGKGVARAEEKAKFDARGRIGVTVAVDIEAGTITLEAAGARVSARMTGPMDAIRYFGYGGANSDNVFGPIRVGQP